MTDHRGVSSKTAARGPLSWFGPFFSQRTQNFLLGGLCVFARAFFVRNDNPPSGIHTLQAPAVLSRRTLPDLSENARKIALIHKPALQRDLHQTLVGMG